MNDQIKKILISAFCTCLCLACISLLAPIFKTLTRDEAPEVTVPPAQDMTIMSDFETHMDTVLADAREGIQSIPKRFWLNEGQPLPARDMSKYGTAQNPGDLEWLLEEAAVLLDGQETLFRTDLEIREGTEITYYLDESIMAVCWQQVLNNTIYTIAEIKISDPMQFQRYMADGYFGSTKLYPTTALSAQAGAVIAGSGDYFRARPVGIVVYDGEIKRFTGITSVDSCFVDENSNFIMTPAGTFGTEDQLEAYIQENNIRFSFAFGPILIQDGERVDHNRYALGQILEGYSRCAVCQKDDLHYLIVTTNASREHFNFPTTAQFTDQLETFNVRHAYSMDGGQTGAIVMADTLLNPTEYVAGQRNISDMYFFATAVPNVNEHTEPQSDTAE